MIKRKVYSIPSILMVSALISSSLSAQQKPNILWLTSEDNNIHWVGCYGNSHAETPNIDALASEGFRYTHCYANAPVCAPSRSTWITGLHAISMGTHNMRSRYEIPHDQIKYYPDYLKEAGYYVSNGRKTDYNIGGRADADCWDDMDKVADGQAVDWKMLKRQQPFFKIINFTESHESRAQGDVENTIHDPAYAERVASMRGALKEWQIKIHDSGLIPESELVRMAGEQNLTHYEFVRQHDLYDVERFIEVSDLALEQDPANLDKLRSGLSHKELGVRYWSMVGCFLLKDALAGSLVINDPSHEVRALAAWTLVQAGQKERGIKVMKELLENGSYATLTILNMADWMGDDGAELIETISKLKLDEKEQSYEIRMQENLLQKFGRTS